jgi:hypothetical protein
LNRPHKEHRDFDLAQKSHGRICLPAYLKATISSSPIATGVMAIRSLAAFFADVRQTA